jgi:hypothetical protein
VLDFDDAAAAKVIEKKHLMYNRMLNQMANLVDLQQQQTKKTNKQREKSI